MRPQLWHPRSIGEDRLLEIGPYEQYLLARNYAFLKFERAGTIFQVAVMPALITELEKALLEDSFSFHFLHGRPQENFLSYALIALGPEGGLTCAIDLETYGAQDIESDCRRGLGTGRRALCQGAALIAAGVPLVAVGLGVPLVRKGRALWSSGRSLTQTMKSQLALMDECAAFVARLPNVRRL